MASSARIEELERKFTENPRRFFAPLANEFRKAGQLKEAISLCREFVPQQPGHMSGHIVLGQALFEAGEYDEARAVFTTALELDPENLIALRHLGDIARVDADMPTARMWYQRVLEVDPRNDDTVALLATVNASVAASPEATGGTVGDVGPSVDAADGAAGWGGINPLPLPDIAHEIRSIPALPRLPEALPRFARVTPPAGAPDPVLDGMEDEEEMRRAPTEPGYAFVTETMAQLYLQQGHREEALKVYRQLLAQRPTDGVLRARVERLEAENAERLRSMPPVPEPIESAIPESAIPLVTAPVMSSRTPAQSFPPTRATPSAPAQPQAGARTREPAPQSAQTVRAFFAAFATRRPTSLQGVRATLGEGSASVAARAEYGFGIEASPLGTSARESAIEPAPAHPDVARLSDEAFDAYDSAAYGAESLVAGSWPTPRSNDFEDDQSSDLRARGESEYHNFALPDPDPLAPGVPPAAEPGVPPLPPVPPVGAKTGSVSALFPGASVAGVDEAAAATLSSAFGGPSASQPLMIPPPAVRPAATELSLDAIFGEDEVAVEAEQFSSWLSGLKKQ